MQKIISSVLTCCAIVASAQVKTIAFEENISFKDVLAKAKKENKLVFMDAYASWCGPCKLMEKNIFPQEAVRSYFNANFINSHFDMEKGEGREIAKKYGVYSYPTFLFLNGDGEMVYTSLGYQEAEDFLAVAKKVNESKYKGLSMKARFEKGEEDPAMLFDLFSQNITTDFDFAKKVSERYFANKKTKDFSREEAMMLVYPLRSIEDPNYRVFVENKQALLVQIPEEEYNNLNTSYKLNKILALSVHEDTKELNEKQFLEDAKKVVSEADARLFLTRFKIHYLPSVGKFEEFGKVAADYYKTGESFDPNELLRAAHLVADYVKDPVVLRKASEWAERSVMKFETPDSTYVLAKLYALTGKKDEAKLFAERSIAVARHSGKTAPNSEKLLQDLSK